MLYIAMAQRCNPIEKNYRKRNSRQEIMSIIDAYNHGKQPTGQKTLSLSSQAIVQHYIDLN